MKCGNAHTTGITIVLMIRNKKREQNMNRQVALILDIEQNYLLA